MYRILKIIKQGNTLYRVQRKGWIFWYYEMNYSIDANGVALHYPINFADLKDAQHYVGQRKKESVTVEEVIL